jgi:rRNA maturation RNase YbeY
MAIEIIFQDVEHIEVNDDLVAELLGLVVHDFDKVLGDVTLVFCSDDYILEANNEVLSHDYYTDIITFDYCEGSVVAGDFLISLDTVRSNAVSFNVDFSDELMRVVVHGVLHLCGLNDKSEQEVLEMRAAEDMYLASCKNPF